MDNEIISENSVQAIRKTFPNCHDLDNWHPSEKPPLSLLPPASNDRTQIAIRRREKMFTPERSPHAKAKGKAAKKRGEKENWGKENKEPENSQRAARTWNASTSLFQHAIYIPFPHIPFSNSFFPLRLAAFRLCERTSTR